MLELLSEPLYILAQLRLRLQLRVFAEASATLARGWRHWRCSNSLLWMWASPYQWHRCAQMDGQRFCGAVVNTHVMMSVCIQQQKRKIFATSDIDA